MQNKFIPIVVLDEDGLIRTFTSDTVELTENLFLDVIRHFSLKEETLNFIEDYLMDGYWEDISGLNKVYLTWPEVTNKIEW